MTREEVLTCLNSNSYTTEFVVEWVTSQGVPEEQISSIVSNIVASGGLPIEAVDDMARKFQINKCLSQEGRLLFWF